MVSNTNSVVITLKLQSNQAQGANQNPTNTSSGKQSNDTDSTAKAVAVFAVTQAVETAVSEVVAWGEYYWNRELMLNDDYIGQRNKNIAITQINRGVGVLSTVGSMTAAGASVGGVWGAIIGAVLGTVTATSNIIRSNIQGQDQQNIMLKQMDAQLEFTRSRVGWSVNAGSIGEDL